MFNIYINIKKSLHTHRDKTFYTNVQRYFLESISLQRYKSFMVWDVFIFSPYETLYLGT